MNQQQQQTSLVQMPIQPEAELVQVGDRLYQISEVKQSPQAIQPYPPIQPRSFWDDPKNLVLVGVGVVGATGIITILMVKAFAPVPIPAPASPQTVIVQPPQPEKRPYTRRDCRPAGLFGWGTDCREERGYE